MAPIVTALNFRLTLLTGSFHFMAGVLDEFSMKSASLS